MNFETHCLHRRPFWIFQNSATMAIFCPVQSFLTLLMILSYLNIYLHVIILILITFYEVLFLIHTSCWNPVLESTGLTIIGTMQNQNQNKSTALQILSRKSKNCGNREPLQFQAVFLQRIVIIRLNAFAVHNYRKHNFQFVKRFYNKSKN